MNVASMTVASMAVASSAFSSMAVVLRLLHLWLSVTSMVVESWAFASKDVVCRTLASMDPDPMAVASMEAASIFVASLALHLLRFLI